MAKPVSASLVQYHLPFFFEFSNLRESLREHEWYSYWRWWIIQAASTHPLWVGFFVSGQSGQTISPCCEAPSDIFYSHVHHSTGSYCNHIWLEWLSSGNGGQWARQQLTRRPSSVRSSCCHGRGTVPVALGQTFAPSFARLHERYSQRFVRARHP